MVAAGIGLLFSLMAGLFAATVGRGILGAVPGLGETRESFGEAGQAWPLLAFFAVAMFIMSVMIFGGLLRSLVMLACAVTDLGAAKSVVGQVLRIHGIEEKGTWLAVYDGIGDRLRAWMVAPALLTGISEGDVVRVTVTPRLGYVSHVDHDLSPRL